MICWPMPRLPDVAPERASDTPKNESVAPKYNEGDN
jgi:hypothetical protein